MPFSIKLQLEQGFAGKFKRDVTREIKEKLFSSIPKAIKKIQDRIQQEVKERLISSPVYDSLADGTLEGEFGLRDGAARISEIIDLWVDSISVKFEAGAGSLGGISIGIFREGWSEVLSSTAAAFTVSNKKGKSVTLDWLRWLLIEGDAIIVANYQFDPSEEKSSRTGEGIMVRRKGGGWRVPSQFAGTDNDNFATRALEGIEQNIDMIVRQEITKGL